jgi:hypothetical protein
MNGSTGFLRLRNNGLAFAYLVNDQVDAGPFDTDLLTLIDTSGLVYPNVDLFTPMDQL